MVQLEATEPPASEPAPAPAEDLPTGPTASSPPALQVAAADEDNLPAGADLAAPPPILPPTIDMLQIGGTETLASGEGPAGSTIRLYLDGRLAGEAPVIDGRWVIEDIALGDAPEQDMRIEAVDPGTGKVLGTSRISIEIELPDDAAPEPQPPPTPVPDTSSTAPSTPVPTVPPPRRRANTFRESPSVQVLGPGSGQSIITLGG